MSEKSLVEWHRRLRSEIKFSGIDELIAQIEKDKENTRNTLKNIVQILAFL